MTHCNWFMVKMPLSCHGSTRLVAKQERSVGVEQLLSDFSSAFITRQTLAYHKPIVFITLKSHRHAFQLLHFVISVRP